MEKILYLTSNLFPCHAGDSIFSAGLLERVAANSEVDVVAVNYKNKSFSDDKNYIRIKNKCSSISFVDYTLSEKVKKFFIKDFNMSFIKSKISEKIVEMISNKQYNYIIIDHLRLYYLYSSISTLIDKSKIKVILLEHNVEYLNLQEEIAYQDSLVTKMKLKILQRNLRNEELQAIKNIDALWCISEKDLHLLVSMAEFKGETKVIPPYFEYNLIKTEKDLQKNTYNLLFLGSMSWYPNVQGIEYFISNIFNKILEIDNRYKLYIVGKNPAQTLEKYKSDKVIITGGVDSIDSYIKDCDLLIMPNKLGSGVKIKVLEGILKGIPVISFSEGLIGYPEKIFEDGFCVNSDEEFARNIILINNSVELKRKFIQEAQKEIQRMKVLS